MRWSTYACPKCDYHTEQPAGADVWHLCANVSAGKNRRTQLHVLEDQAAAPTA